MDLRESFSSINVLDFYETKRWIVPSTTHHIWRGSFSARSPCASPCGRSKRLRVSSSLINSRVEISHRTSFELRNFFLSIFFRYFSRSERNEPISQWSCRSLRARRTQQWHFRIPNKNVRFLNSLICINQLGAVAKLVRALFIKMVIPSAPLEICHRSH